MFRYLGLESFSIFVVLRNDFQGEGGTPLFQLHECLARLFSVLMNGGDRCDLHIREFHVNASGGS